MVCHVLSRLSLVAGLYVSAGAHYRLPSFLIIVINWDHVLYLLNATSIHTFVKPSATMKPFSRH